ncbi:MAG: hypothetical protein ABFS35_15535 [Bacteroidota bacterium]
MKQKLTIGIAVSLILAVLIVMSYDLFMGTEGKKDNQYEYDLTELKKIDESKICYSEIQKIEPDVKKLYGIAIDAEDNIYITTDNNVLIYNQKLELSQTIKTNNKARCITIGADGRIYLGMKNYLTILNKDGSLIEKWDTINKAAYITSIAVNESSVFVADAGNKVVHYFNKKGELVNQFGKKNKEKGIPGLFIPSPYFDVLLGRDGELWAINTGRHSFEAYDFEGNLKSSWARTSMDLDGFSGCCNPSHVAMLSDGSFVTSEKGIERVKIHLPSGDFKCVVAGPGQFEEGTKGLDLAVNSKDQIFVLDPKKGMVRVFEQTKN